MWGRKWGWNLFFAHHILHPSNTWFIVWQTQFLANQVFPLPRADFLIRVPNIYEGRSLASLLGLIVSEEIQSQFLLLSSIDLEALQKGQLWDCAGFKTFYLGKKIQFVMSIMIKHLNVRNLASQRFHTYQVSIARHWSLSSINSLEHLPLSLQLLWESSNFRQHWACHQSLLN